MTARTAITRMATPLLGVALLGLTLLGLHALGTGALSAPPVGHTDDLRVWVSERDPVVIGFVLIRLIAMAGAWYLVATIVVGILARLSRIPSLITWADMATLPVVRRLITTMFGLSVTAAAASVAAVPMLTSPQQRDGGRPAGMAVTMQRAKGTVVVMRTEPEGDDQHTATMRLIQPNAAPEPDPATSTWVVSPGDSLWSLAAHHLETTWKRSPSEDEILHYWQQTLEHNRTRLVDPQNPELIYAGQVLEAPPVPQPG